MGHAYYADVVVRINGRRFSFSFFSTLFTCKNSAKLFCQSVLSVILFPNKTNPFVVSRSRFHMDLLFHVLVCILEVDPSPLYKKKTTNKVVFFYNQICLFRFGELECVAINFDSDLLCFLIIGERNAEIIIIVIFKDWINCSVTFAIKCVGE